MRQRLLLFVTLLALGGAFLIGSPAASALYNRNRTVPTNTFSTASTWPDNVTTLSTWTTGLTHTVPTGNDRLLVFAPMYEDCTADVGITTITWGGRTMTRIAGGATSTSCFERTELWYLKEADIRLASGTTFVVTWGGTAPTDRMYAAGSYAGVFQTTPISASNTNFTNTTSPNPITTTLAANSGQMVVSAVVNGNTGSYSWNNSFVEDTDQQGTGSTGSTADKLITSSGTQTPSGTHSNTLRQAMVSAAINMNPVELADAWTTGLTHTVAAGLGGNRLLMFSVGYENCTDVGVTTVTFGTRTLTRITGAAALTAACYSRTELWYLNEAGLTAASNSTFVVTWGGTAPTSPAYSAAVYRNVYQTSPVVTSNTAVANAATPNPITAAVTVALRQMVVSTVTTGNTGSYTWNNSFVERTDQAIGATTTFSTADKSPAAAGTETASATHTGPNRQAIVVAVLRPD